MFSVVIPVYNHELYLGPCVLSAARNPLVSEVLLLDDGSTDNSYEVARILSSGSLAKVRDVTPSPRVNRGAHVALNALVDQAACEWIAVLNSDDTFVPSRFQTIARRLRREDCDLIFGDLVVVDGGGRQIGRKRGAFDPQLPFPASFDLGEMAREGAWLDLLSHQNFLATTSNMVFRKSLFRKIGGFAPYRYVHDWDFALRACLKGRVTYVAQPMTSYRVHGANTIKESARRVDAEVQQMFAKIVDDFPELQMRARFQEGLAENPYLETPGSCFLTVITPAGEHAGFYAEALRTAIANVQIIETPTAGEAEKDDDEELDTPRRRKKKVAPPAPAGRYIYAPSTLLGALSPVHLQGAVLALSCQDMDFLLVSHSLAEPPRVGVSSLRDQAVFRAQDRDVFVENRAPLRPMSGRIARLFPGRAPAQDLGAMLAHMAPVVHGAELGLRGVAPAIARRESLAPDVLLAKRDEPKPVIFILPTVFAVGGVERLVVEMMRQLRERYDFVVITVERLHEGQGSLHGAAEGIAIGFYDLAELAPPALFLEMMKRLRDDYRPCLVWVPNGSPWQCDNAPGIREIFAEIPIVDQQAYDTEAGWIARYGEAGIQSYDRFVAINRKIEDTLMRKYKIPARKIDMIYHSVNLDALGPIERSEAERAGYREKWGLPEAARLIGWIGRLTPQKRPLEFLEFARRAEGCHFVMIGNGELAGECDAFLEQHSVTCVTPVRFSNQMGELFAVMSGLVSTSAYEGLPISMLEALSMGVPIFGTDVGDVGLILEEYGAGRVTAAEWDLERYLAAFERWLAELPRWTTGAQEAAARVRQRFAGETVAGQYDQCWRRAIAERAATSSMPDITAGLCNGNSVKA